MSSISERRMSHDRLSAANHAFSLISFSEVLASPVFFFSLIAPGERFSYRNNPFSVLFLAGKFSPAFFRVSLHFVVDASVSGTPHGVPCLLSPGRLFRRSAKVPC